MWRFLVLLSLSHKVFWVRCGTNCIDSWHLPSSLLFILTRVPTHKKYRLLCYALRSNSGWLPIRCAYFILLFNSCLSGSVSMKLMGCTGLQSHHLLGVMSCSKTLYHHCSYVCKPWIMPWNDWKNVDWDNNSIKHLFIKQTKIWFKIILMK